MARRHKIAWYYGLRRVLDIATIEVSGSLLYNNATYQNRDRYTEKQINSHDVIIIIMYIYTLRTRPASFSTLSSWVPTQYGLSMFWTSVFFFYIYFLWCRTSTYVGTIYYIGLSATKKRNSFIITFFFRWWKRIFCVILCLDILPY